jgi:hypothetical protein
VFVNTVDKFSFLIASMPQPAADLHTVRRENLHALIREFVQARVSAGEPANGAERAFAEQLQMSKSLLSHLKSSRNISDAIAQQIEARCKKPSGWLSSPHSNIEARPAPGEEAFVALVREKFRSADRTQRARLRSLVEQFK